MAPEYVCENFNINQGNTRGASNLNFSTPNTNLCSTNSFSYNASQVGVIMVWPTFNYRYK